MTLWEAAILGVVQGVTEYLPVSSSGHLVLVPAFFGMEKGPFVFDILVQLGTLVGVLFYFRGELQDIALHMLKGLKERDPLATWQARYGWWVVVATIPAAALGLLLHDVVEEAFSSPQMTLGFLYCTAAMLFIGEKFGKRCRDHESLGFRDAVIIGLAQVLALFPGVSRSGSTIAAGMVRGLTRDAAARFSFLMSIPVMVGAGMVAMVEVLEEPSVMAAHGPAIAVGFLTAAISGYVVIHWFLRYLQNRSLHLFAIYCTLLATVGFLWLP
jgi:undecaprenyl-diphosphatase